MCGTLIGLYVNECFLKLLNNSYSRNAVDLRINGSNI